jgi:hypothetical protein
VHKKLRKNSSLQATRRVGKKQKSKNRNQRSLNRWKGRHTRNTALLQEDAHGSQSSQSFHFDMLARGQAALGSCHSRPSFFYSFFIEFFSLLWQLWDVVLLNRDAMAAQSLRLVYLPFRAMAETTRMLLAVGQVQYDDEAVWGL